MPVKPMKFSKLPTKAELIGWKPRAWKRDGRKLWHGNGRIKPRGQSYTRSPASNRRKARSLARRKAA